MFDQTNESSMLRAKQFKPSIHRQFKLNKINPHLLHGRVLQQANGHAWVVRGGLVESGEGWWKTMRSFLPSLFLEALGSDLRSVAATYPHGLCPHLLSSLNQRSRNGCTRITSQLLSASVTDWVSRTQTGEKLGSDTRVLCHRVQEEAAMLL